MPRACVCYRCRVDGLLCVYVGGSDGWVCQACLYAEETGTPRFVPVPSDPGVKLDPVTGQLAYSAAWLSGSEAPGCGT